MSVIMRIMSDRFSNNPWIIAVVGGAFAIVLGAWLLEWHWADVELVFSGIAAGVTKARDWFAAPATIPHWLLLLIVGSIVLLVRADRRQARAHDRLRRRLHGHAKSRFHAPNVPLQSIKHAPSELTVGFNPTPGQLAILNRTEETGNRLFEKDAFRVLKRIDATATRDDASRALRDLIAGGALGYLDDDDDPKKHHYVLTYAGHDYVDTIRKSRRI